jgi:HPt (histidine-containing phosphotransfer) domain-containing protein
MTDALRTAAAPETSVDFDARLLDLRRRFVERTRRDGETIRTLRTRWGAGETIAADQLRDLARIVHGLSGAAGVFGFDDISEAAHRAEMSLRNLDGPSSDPLVRLDALIVGLETLWT